MKQLRLHHNKTHGFTLLEIVIVVGIIGVIGVVIGKFQADIFTFNRYFSSQFSLSDSAQKLLRPMTEEIRSASPSNNGSYPIDSVGQYSFAFYSDINNDGTKEWVRYVLTGTTLFKETIVPTGTPAVYNQANKVTTTFMTGVRNQTEGIPIFTYYDDTYTGDTGGVVDPTTGTVESVRLVGVRIRIDDDLQKLPPLVEVQSQVAIRNLKIQE